MNSDKTAMNMFNLEGSTILITGGYGYLGSALALGIADYGANVCVLGRSKERFDAAFRTAKQDIQFIPCDIADAGSLRNAVTTAMDIFGSVDVLINNAMYCRGSDPLEINDDDWAFSVDGVLSSVYRGIREVAPILKEQRSGNIVNIASMYGMVAPDFSVYQSAPESLNPPHYGAAKAAVIQLTRYYSKYLGPWNIRVNSISPGPFPNPDVQKNEAFIGALESRTSLGRIGQAHELVGAAVFLCSSASTYVTGQNLAVDGGWTAV